MSQLMYRVAQPYGTDKARESTIISEHATEGDAFAEIDNVAEEFSIS
jgi:hypothetical protein